MSAEGASPATLACTQKLRKLLGSSVAPAPDNPADGPVFYANLVWAERRKCLIFAEAETLFCFMVPDVSKADITPVGDFFVPRLEFELVTEGLPLDLFGSLDQGRVGVAPTSDRAVVGSLVEFARLAEYWIDDVGGIDRMDWSRLNQKLRRVPMARHRRSYRFPIDAAMARAEGSSS